MEEAWTKRNFFAQKLSNLGPVLNKLMQLEHATKGVWGAEPPSHWANFVILQKKNSNFIAISFTFHMFLKPYE